MKKVAALAGRRPDEESAAVARFPLDRVGPTKDALEKLFNKEKFTHLVCAAACGADLLALDVASSFGVECHILLPFSKSHFREVSVVDRPGDWGSLYDKLIEDASALGRLHLLGYMPSDKNAYSKANQAIVDFAKSLAEEATAFSIIVWDGKSKGEDDATGEFAMLCQKAGFYEIEVLTI